MKQGHTLQELAAEVMRISDAKKDFIADTRNIHMKIGTPDQEIGLLDAVIDETRRQSAIVQPRFEIDGVGEFGIRETAHSQIAGKAGIPLTYYRRMWNDAPHLLVSNVNHWLINEPSRRMVRTLDGDARAFLSDRYRILDNDELLEAVLPVISDLKVKIESSAVTEKKIYLKCTFPQVEGEVKPGDVVRAGFVLSNSEVGQGSVSVQPLVLRLVCRNGAVMNDARMKRFHVGRANGNGDDPHRFFKDDTLKADDQAFMLKVRDTIQGAADEAQFKATVDRMKESTERKIEGNPVEAVEVVKKKYSLQDSERDGVLHHLIHGGDLSHYGLTNALTRMSQDVENYDRASDLERFGGKMFEMSGREWAEIGKAA